MIIFVLTYARVSARVVGGDPRYKLKTPSDKRLREDIKSSGKFAIFSYLNIEGGGGLRLITEKWQLKIKLSTSMEKLHLFKDRGGRGPEGYF